MSLTIPLCLEVLGSMRDSDPAVVVTDGESVWCAHPLTEIADIYDPSDDDRLLVEQSEPTLLRVLCRHLGWNGEGLPMLTEEEDWILCARTAGGDWTDLECLPSHISPDLDHPDRIEALAEAVVWYARIARLGCDFTGTPERLALAEQHSNTSTPTWAVQR